MSGGPGFTVWLLLQQGRNDKIGDLSNDVWRDGKWPVNSSGEAMKQHLEDHGACQGAIDALESALSEYHGVDTSQ